MTSWRRWRKCFSPVRIRGDVVEQVGEDRHDAPLLEPLGQVVEDDAQVRLLARGRHVEQVEQLLQVRRLPGRLQVAADRVVEDDQADRVLLLEDHVGQRRRDELGVLQLA